MNNKKNKIKIGIVILLIAIIVWVFFSFQNNEIVALVGQKSSSNKYVFQFDTKQESKEPATEIVVVPELQRFYSLKIEGTTSVKEIIERRRFVDGKQHGIRRIENVISEGSPNIHYVGEKYDTLFPAYLRNRIAEIYGKESPFTFKSKDNYGFTGAGEVSYNNKKFVIYEGPLSWFEFTPDLELFMRYGELIGVKNLKELEDVYNEFVVNGETYKSDTLEIDYDAFYKTLILVLPEKSDWFEDAAVVQDEIETTNAYVNLHYTQEEIDGWYEKYGVRESYD